GSGPPNGFWQFQINGGSWTNIGDFANQFSSSSTSGASIAAMNLSGVAGLQNLAAGSVVNLRLVPYGATGSNGTWYVFDLSGNDLVVNGSVAPVTTASTTALTDNGPNPTVVGQSVNFAVSVSGLNPTGTVSLEDAHHGNAV